MSGRSSRERGRWPCRIAGFTQRWWYASERAEGEAGRAQKENPLNSRLGRKRHADLCHLFKFTDQGLRTVKETVKRTEAAKKAATEAGIKVKEVLWLEGEYDLIAISEADEITHNAFTLSTAKQGNAHTRTMRAFTAAEMEKILAKVV